MDMEKFFSFATKNRAGIILFFCLVIVLGIFSFARIHVSLMPGRVQHVVTVKTEYPEMEPEIIEELITKPLESIVRVTDGVEKFYSYSTRGVSRIICYLFPETEVDGFCIRLQDNIYHISGDFPPEARKPSVLKYNSDDAPSMILVVSSKAYSEGTSGRKTIPRREAESLRNAFVSADGVSNVEYTGVRKKEYLVSINYQDLLLLEMGRKGKGLYGKSPPWQSGELLHSVLPVSAYQDDYRHGSYLVTEGFSSNAPRLPLGWSNTVDLNGVEQILGSGAEYKPGWRSTGMLNSSEKFQNRGTQSGTSGGLSTGGLYELIYREIVKNNLFFPVGSVEDSYGVSTLRFENGYMDFLSLADSTVTINGKPVRFDSILKVYEKDAIPEKLSLVNGKQRVTFYIFRKDGAGLLELHRNIMKKIMDFTDIYKIDIIYSQADDFKKLLNQLYLGILISLIFIFVFLVFVYRRIFVSFFVFMVIPFCLAGTLFVFWILSKTINLMSLSGLILGTGLSVDNVIIVMDSQKNSVRSLSHRVSCTGFIKRKTFNSLITCGFKKANRTILASTLTTISVFAPVFYFNGEGFIPYRDFALSFSSMLVFSYVFSLLFVPLFFSGILYGVGLEKMAGTKKKRMSFLKYLDTNYSSGFAQHSGKDTGNGNINFSESCEGGKVSGNLERPVAGFLMACPAVYFIFYLLVAMVSIFIFVKFPYRELSPLKRKEIEYYYYFNSGFSRDYKAGILAELSDELMVFTSRANAVLISTLEGDSIRFVVDLNDREKPWKNILLSRSSFPRHVFFTSFFRTSFKNILLGYDGFPSNIFSSIRDRLILARIKKNYYERKREELLRFVSGLAKNRRSDGFFYFPAGYFPEEAFSKKDEFNKNFIALPFFRGKNRIKTIVFEFFGDDLVLLNKRVDEASIKVFSLPWTRGVYKGYRESENRIDVQLDSSTAYHFGINPTKLIRFMRYLFYQPVLMKFYDGDELVDVRAGISFQNSQGHLYSALSVPDKDNNYVRIEDFSEQKKIRMPVSISRKNGKRFIPLEIKYSSISEEDFIPRAMVKFETIDMTRGMYFTLDEGYYKKIQARKNFIISILVAVFLIYLVLGVVLNSFSIPVYVMLIIPSIFFGPLLFMVSGGFSRSMPLHMGVYLLAGVSVNIIVLLVEDLRGILKSEMIYIQHNNTRDKTSLYFLVSDVFSTNMRIIFLTFSTTLLGVLPVFLLSRATYFFRVLTGVFSFGMAGILIFSIIIFPVISRIVAGNFYKKCK